MSDETHEFERRGGGEFPQHVAGIPIVTMQSAAAFSQAGVAATLPPAKAVTVRSLSVLDGGELIELSLKPALWFIPLVSWRPVGACALLAATLLVAGAAQTFVGAWILAIVIAMALARVALASLQWAARLFLLTNRRVLRFRGVLAPEMREAPLRAIRGVELRITRMQAALGLGTVVIAPNSEEPPIAWEHIANPREVHRKILAAIARCDR